MGTTSTAGQIYLVLMSTLNHKSYLRMSSPGKCNFGVNLKKKCFLELSLYEYILQFTVHCSFVALCFHTKFLLCMAALSYNLNIIYIFHHIMKVNCIFFSKPLQIHNVWKLQSIFSPLLLHICWVESKSSSNHLKF